MGSGAHIADRYQPGDAAFAHGQQIGRYIPPEVQWRIFCDFFGTVARGETQVGIVPVENSLNGVVAETYDCLIETPLQISAESLLPIHHALMARCGLGDVKLVYSHPQVFAQSREWLRENLAEAEQVAMSSTATASDRAAREPNAAALAPAIASDAYGLNILAENIEDRPDNRTRFFVVGQSDSSPSGRDKTSIVFAASPMKGFAARSESSATFFRISFARAELRTDSSPNARFSWPA